MAVEAGKQFLRDLADLAARLCTATSQLIVSTGDILSGISNCSMGRAHRRPLQLLAKRPNPRWQNCLTSIAVGLVDKVLTKALPEDDLRNSIPSKKRPWEDTPPPPREGYRSSRSVSSAPGNSPAARATTMAIHAARNSLETAEVSRPDRLITHTRATLAALAAAAIQACQVADCSVVEDPCPRISKFTQPAKLNV